MNEAASAIYTKLQTRSQLTSLLAGTTAIYNMQAPDNATLPYVVFSLAGGGDENFDAHRTKNLVYFIRGYSKVSAAQAGSIDAQIDSAMHLQSLNVGGWSNFWTAREEDLTAVETLQNGEKIWMSGGNFRVRIEDT